MERNHYSKKMETKSDNELNKIIADKDTYVEEAIQAAILELNKRNIDNSNKVSHAFISEKTNEILDKKTDTQNPDEYQKTFNTDNLKNKINRTMSLSIALIVIGVIILIFKDYSNFYKFRDYIAILSGLFFPIFGLIMYISNSKKLKKISDSYITFKKDEISFKSREIEKTVKSNELKSITIRLNTIEVDILGNIFNIHLDDYTEFSDKKAIKNNFELLNKNKLYTTQK